MGSITGPGRVKLITGVLFSDAVRYAAAERRLIKAFGPVDYKSEVMDFTHTSYYDKEMGGGIKRVFLSFSRPAGLDGICSAKLKTDKIEGICKSRGSRKVNIDPGYLNLSKLVLLSTKDFSHRIYLGRGIYAEVTLLYKAGNFVTLPWTYLDYRTAEYHSIFSVMRDIYKTQHRGGSV